MSDFRFLYPEWLAMMLPLAIMVIWLIKRSRSKTLIAPHLAKAMGLSHNSSRNLSISIAVVTGVIAIVALAGPSFTASERPSFSNQSGRVLIMDMSMSMYATDIKPNRLTQAKYKASDLLKQWQEGSTGLIAYAVDAYTISPMTSDTHTILNLIPNLSPDLMPFKGANAAIAVEQAISMMKNTGLSQGDLVLTDDIDDQADNIETLLKGTKWRLTILGVGSQVGSYPALRWYIT